MKLIYNRVVASCKNLLFFVLTFLIANLAKGAALLEPEQSSKMNSQVSAFNQGAGFTITTTVGGVVASVVQAFLGLLGIIFVILIISAGYNWMTAAGEEEKVNKAKDTIKRAIIGIIITIGAYAITYFVLSNIQGVDTGPLP
jgi:amino acid transporter